MGRGFDTPWSTNAHSSNGKTRDSDSWDRSSTLWWAANGGSSNGRTDDFGSFNLGSNPSPPAIDNYIAIDYNILVSPSGGMEDTPDSKSGAAMRAGSNPALGTIDNSAIVR